MHGGCIWVPYGYIYGCRSECVFVLGLPKAYRAVGPGGVDAAVENFEEVRPDEPNGEFWRTAMFRRPTHCH